MSGALTVTVQDAAKLMGVAELRVRGLIRRKEVDYGEAFPSGNINKWSKRPERTTYVIYAPRFARYVGLTLEELRKEIEKLHEISN